MNTTLVDQQPLSQSMTKHPPSVSSSSGATPVLIDVRTPKEFEEVRIPEARNIPLPDLHKFLDELKVLSQERPITLICRTQNRVKIAYDYLTNNGVSNCRILEGGITAWVNSGKPVVRGRKGISLEGQVRAIAGSLVVLGVGLGISISAWFLIIPALVGIGLIHAGLTDSCLMGMLLSKLPMNRISHPPIQ
ncbi:MAG: rhodanese-like domain-containing protein [Nitrospirota bacterium]|jgi:rhodanese-related sulfurtransferase|nr:rhodanese-like domain-containing protein [Nitrospirota bacterium]MDH4361239.1 rhodanese-like domain-containing protein [Nitrospirota bacterium]MDH5575002.1 rhodanese-like domain-containing protein [Nitrospirota bacterium]